MQCGVIFSIELGSRRPLPVLVRHDSVRLSAEGL